MPAAAVIPAPIAYIKVVAVKKLVVGSVECPEVTIVLSGGSIIGWKLCGIRLLGSGHSSFTVRKLERSKQAYAVEYVSME